MFGLTLRRADDRAGDDRSRPTNKPGIPHWSVAVEVLLKRMVVGESERSVVAEVDARHVPGAQNDHCLICETERAIRRIWRYPADWHRMEDAKLMALFEQPFTAAKAAPAGEAQDRSRPSDREVHHQPSVDR